ncbi:4'-phosphopantetheinyl transferase [Kitasatospora gansuensis]|uniref:4'-phosphopantetheinyl transferase n=1 Tax=Kitasatospora gansuensis TaxID=258050 RepID=A0A7W7WFQ6_9ACTN|nr:4'-phosphopantetheinyl transferase superfamily protein [Kitasatospora gansuensis]MBB4944654.1 4'-phosphopantetheinyl transferase [Kitasatospora gansuensis]
MSTDTVTLWVIPTDQPPPVVDRLHRLLDHGERERARAMPDPVRRARFVVGRGAVRLLAARPLGLPPAELAWRRGPHGKPEPVHNPTGAQFSWSGSGSLAVLAVAPGRPVGADVEELPAERVAVRVAGRYFPPEEARFVADGPSARHRSARFTQLWCRREAGVKVYGGRLAQGLPLRLVGRSPFRLDMLNGLSAGPCWVRDIRMPGPFRAAVALDGPAPFQVRRRTWTPYRPPLDPGAADD